MREPMLKWVHKGACGGLPGTEATLAAWDAQHDMEKALLRNAGWSQINMDYDKFFDKFDPEFFAHLNLAMGIPADLTFLFKDLYNNIQRRFRIGQHNGSVIQHNRGGGQGDSLWLLDAIIITSIQFKMIEAEYPNVKLGSVVDDRNF